MATRIHRQEQSGERVLTKVPSASRPGRVHFVDVENERCSCEGFTRHGHCYHVENLKCAYCSGYGTYVSYPRLMTCLHCDGTGRSA